jgi:hypothetical protein
VKEIFGGNPLVPPNPMGGKIGGLGDWRIGGLEDWGIGGLEDWGL